MEMPMLSPWLTKLFAAVAVTLLPCLVVWAGGRGVASSAKDPIYTVASLRAQLLQEPDQWVDRTVRVRAVPAICDPCGTWLPGFVDPGPHATEQFLPIVPGDPPPLLATLRRLPLVGLLAPQPQVLVWDRPAVYRVRLRRIDCLSAQDRVCAAAVLLDAAPEP
jgi:hypothetical protein